MSLRLKYFLVCVLVITVPFMISGLITYKQYISFVEKDTRNYVVQITDQIRMNLDNYIDELDKITLTPYYQNAVIATLAKHNKPWSENVYAVKEEQLNMNLYLSSQSRKNFVGLVLLANDGSLFSDSNDISASKWSLLDAAAVDTVNQADGKLVILPPHIAYYYKRPAHVFSVARLIREPGTNKPLGTIKIDLNENAFLEFLETVKLGNGSKVQIMDKEGRMFYPELSGEISQQNNQVTPFAVDTGDLIEKAFSSYSNLFIVGSISKNELHKDAEKLVLSTLYLSILSLVVAYIIAALFSNQLVKPIRKLQMSMKRIARGSFTERVAVSATDEMGQLAVGFNLMVSEIERLVHEVYETRVKERESEITALQSQINPHFMYNTLELINMMALQQGSLEISDVTSSFGKLLRYTVDKERMPVRLIDEFRFVEAYMQIQSFRFGDSIVYSIDLHPELEQCWVPKLILQPIIENAIQHGVGDSGGQIRVRAEVENGDLILAIEDNGKGMTPEDIKKIYAGLYEEHSKNKQETSAFGTRRGGYALYNLFHRIQLLYGEPYGLYIDSKVQQGSLVYLRLPLSWELPNQRRHREEDQDVSRIDR
ncbi:sensor histidine kinase [Paenibacillus sp. GXUN7292]|uniref:sensor histidine kinase n=1 Tax=Paenibacillus sp. GXUN7292 TaxID=3422499 RepID=UPI003D7D32F9